MGFPNASSLPEHMNKSTDRMDLARQTLFGGIVGPDTCGNNLPKLFWKVISVGFVVFFPAKPLLAGYLAHFSVPWRAPPPRPT